MGRPPRNKEMSALEGRRASVWWPRKQTFLQGTLQKYNATLGCFAIRYDDGVGMDSYFVMDDFELQPDGSVEVREHYVLDFPEGWRPTAEDNEHRRSMMGPLAPKNCGACKLCIQNPGNRKACHQVRTLILSHHGHYGARVAAMGPNAVGTRVRVFWPADRAFYSGFITDWNWFTWKHQILYDDGDIEERTLYKEKVARVRPQDLSSLRPKWLPERMTLEGFNRRGRFRSRELQRSLVGMDVLVYMGSSALGPDGEKAWRRGRVVDFNQAELAHGVEFARPRRTELMQYDKHVVFVLSPSAKGEDGLPSPSPQKRPRAADATPTGSLAGTQGSEPAEPGPANPPPTPAGRPAEPAVPATPAPGSVANPLMQSQADYRQVMQWVSEFLRNDPRVPRNAQKLMAIHEEVRKGQVMMGLHSSNPEQFYGHTFAAMGLAPEEWHDDRKASDAIKTAKPELQTSFRCSQGLINTLFHSAP
uniref:Uncharacterized protein n=1 Tax=Tetraselmis sp. GSL018 TaxID=582737 RepID=A0A061R6N0_9CHLO|mmetsp:Transcript_5400/g.13144  ORF Transcript_5400/g.13144 Transcript_5400/m.13144 type:complete len:475 (-) Transcript_5400:476-1900(-)